MLVKGHGKALSCLSSSFPSSQASLTLPFFYIGQLAPLTERHLLPLSHCGRALYPPPSPLGVSGELRCFPCGVGGC